MRVCCPRASESLRARHVLSRDISATYVGVHYDTGTVFRGPGYAISTRRAALDLSAVRRELEIIRDDLRANAVRIVGSDVGRLTAVAGIALGLGLEVWFSPAFFEYPPEETTARLVAAAEPAARLAAAHPGRPPSPGPPAVPAHP